MRNKIKILEKNGPQLQMLLTKSDPWVEDKCCRTRCEVCDQEGDRTPYCRQTNLTYKSTCRICSKKGIQAAYIGETSRSLHKRLHEHAADSKKRQEHSHMATHMMKTHPEEWKSDQDTCWKHYKVEIIKVHRSSFIRQLPEAVAIMLQQGITLNVDAEYNRWIVPSLEVKGTRKESNQ